MRWVSNDPGGSDFTPPGVDVSQTWQDQSSGAFFSPDHPLETRRSVLEHSEVMFWGNSIVEGPQDLMAEMLFGLLGPALHVQSRVCYQIHPLLVETGVKGLLLLSPKVHKRCLADVQSEAVLLTP